MASKMLIDAAHPEETRVAVVRGNRIEEFDYESASRRPLKGNIYLAKVTRVEPSLQAAFVEYGGNRHGFLAFSEIHPDYYQIPVADRQALLEAEAEDARLAREEEDDEAEKPKRSRRRRSRSARSKDDKVESETVADGEDEAGGEAADDDNEANGATEAKTFADEADDADEAEASANGSDEDDGEDDDDEVDTVAEDAEEETEAAAPKPRKRAPRKVYKIQEVIKRRQVLLIQVVKEERGNKGAALTTYLSLAGRYCVLMPNTARGGGISRKISDASDRRRLKEVIKDIDVSEGMGLIVRTAGAQRTKTEIKRDYDYLMRMWESVRELTLKSSAPTLVYEEGDLIKRSIRDLYSKDIDEIQVEGEEGYKEAKEFMKMLMPSHARNVKLYKDTRQLFTRHQVESQLDGLFTPSVTLPSGGYIVMNQTEALVSIDINSGKATREHNIEDTALKTNLEAAVEIARQLRLRDLAGLIVIDFIDMEENRNNRAVERKLKDALKNDRARIQVGRISHFGLLEMSRQRLRQGMMESSTRQCPHCEGTGVIRAVSSCALSVLRGIEEHLLSRKPESLDVRVHPDVAIYIFNEKRDALLSLEQNYGISVYIIPDRECAQAESRIDRKPDRKGQVARPVASDTAVAMGDEFQPNEEPETEEAEDEDVEATAGEEDDGEPRKKRRRRRGRRGGRRQREQREGDEEMSEASADGDTGGEAEAHAADGDQADGDGDQADGDGESEDKPRKRRRRGGRGRGSKAAADDAGIDDAGTDEEVTAEDATSSDGEADEGVSETAEAGGEDDAKPARKPRKRASKKAAAAAEVPQTTPLPAKVRPRPSAKTMQSLQRSRASVLPRRQTSLPPMRLSLRPRQRPTRVPMAAARRSPPANRSRQKSRPLRAGRPLPRPWTPTPRRRRPDGGASANHA
jgi:ribonuclease E